jgi:hypothetical protein
MRINTRYLLLAILLLASVMSWADIATPQIPVPVKESVSFAITPKTLKPGERGSISVTLNIPSGKHQSHDPSDPAYFYLEASHPSLNFAK